MNLLSEECENGIRLGCKNSTKESFQELLDHETLEKRWLSIESAANYRLCKYYQEMVKNGIESLQDRRNQEN